ncbi:hypothetical protein NSPZN2_80038 [Nitrospira defluvii]|uniref:Uncharacterized protein n=1 Tax=Nitrospira defluvii TaxID=330214 RepID=A0ABN7MFX9_9BACT|nr:hypothetical protein NSPZN2_80038 [Nitrospira defluvii]
MRVRPMHPRHFHRFRADRQLAPMLPPVEGDFATPADHCPPSTERSPSWHDSSDSWRSC